MGEHFIVRNSRSAGPLYPSLRRINIPPLLRTLSLIIGCRLGDGLRDRIKNRFQQPYDGGQLRRGQSLDQLMSVLFGVRHKTSRAFVT
jgi:hypothetical protein